MLSSTPEEHYGGGGVQQVTHHTHLEEEEGDESITSVVYETSFNRNTDGGCVNCWDNRPLAFSGSSTDLLPPALRPASGSHDDSSVTSGTVDDARFTMGAGTPIVDRTNKGSEKRGATTMHSRCLRAPSAALLALPQSGPSTDTDSDCPLFPDHPPLERAHTLPPADYSCCDTTVETAAPLSPTSSTAPFRSPLSTSLSISVHLDGSTPGSSNKLHNTSMGSTATGSSGTEATCSSLLPSPVNAERPRRVSIPMSPTHQRAPKLRATALVSPAPHIRAATSSAPTTPPIGPTAGAGNMPSGGLGIAPSEESTVIMHQSTGGTGAPVNTCTATVVPQQVTADGCHQDEERAHLSPSMMCNIGSSDLSTVVDNLSLATNNSLSSPNRPNENPDRPHDEQEQHRSSAGAGGVKGKGGRSGTSTGNSNNSLVEHHSLEECFLRFPSVEPPTPEQPARTKAIVSLAPQSHSADSTRSLQQQQPNRRTAAQSSSEAAAQSCTSPASLASASVGGLIRCCSTEELSSFVFPREVHSPMLCGTPTTLASSPTPTGGIPPFPPPAAATVSHATVVPPQQQQQQYDSAQLRQQTQPHLLRQEQQSASRRSSIAITRRSAGPTPSPTNFVEARIRYENTKGEGVSALSTPTDLQSPATGLPPPSRGRQALILRSAAQESTCTTAGLQPQNLFLDGVDEPTSTTAAGNSMSSNSGVTSPSSTRPLGKGEVPSLGSRRFKATDCGTGTVCERDSLSPPTPNGQVRHRRRPFGLPRMNSGTNWTAQDGSCGVSSTTSEPTSAHFEDMVRSVTPTFVCSNPPSANRSAAPTPVFGGAPQQDTVKSPLLIGQGRNQFASPPPNQVMQLGASNLPRSPPGNSREPTPTLPTVGTAPGTTGRRSAHDYAMTELRQTVRQLNSRLSTVESAMLQQQRRVSSYSCFPPGRRTDETSALALVMDRATEMKKVALCVIVSLRQLCSESISGRALARRLNSNKDNKSDGQKEGREGPGALLSSRAAATTSRRRNFRYVLFSALVVLVGNVARRWRR